MAPNGTEEEKGMTAFELGVLTSRVQGVIERMDRMERSVGERITTLSGQMTDFARELRTLAEGYVRRQDFDALRSQIAELQQAQARFSPLTSLLWDSVRWVLIAVAGALLALVIVRKPL